MTRENNPTKKQHYIPQIYLRGFSPEYDASRKSKAGEVRYTVNCCELNNDFAQRNVPIKSICYEKNLYEIFDEDGKIILQNYLESVLGKLEQQFSSYRKKLRGKAFIDDNYKTRCFLEREEKIFWMTYITVQIMRAPEMLQLAEQTAEETLGSSINSIQKGNLARTICLPFFSEIKEDSIEARIWDQILTPMCKMHFAVCVDKEAKIITSDNPVYIYCNSFPCEEYEKIIFPISSELCLILLGQEEKAGYAKNFLTPITDGVREMIVKSVADNSKERIFSNHLLDIKERAWVKEAIANKE